MCCYISTVKARGGWGGGTDSLRKVHNFEEKKYLLLDKIKSTVAFLKLFARFSEYLL
jgi:hypothetical protein